MSAALTEQYQDPVRSPLQQVERLLSSEAASDAVIPVKGAKLASNLRLGVGGLIAVFCEHLDPARRVTLNC